MRKVNLDAIPKKGELINWKESIGYIISFEYDDIIEKFTIIDYEIDKHMLTLLYNNINFNISTDNLKKCKLGAMVGKIIYNHKYKINDLIKTNMSELKIIELIKIKINNKSARKGFSFEKGYKYQCLKCFHINKVAEHSLNRGTGCPVCCPSPQKVIKGINDIWVTNPKLAELLVNPEDGYKYSYGSNKKVDWKCPNCENIVTNKKISEINQYGLSCPRCGDGISYPEKIMYNILDQLHINFEKEKTFNWSQRKRYDFYLPDYNCIIEIHGEQHYKQTYRGRTLNEEQENDKIKKQMAKINGIKEYIIIDSRNSDLNWIKNSIINSKLNILFDLNNVNWNLCNKNSLNSLVKIACDLWDTHLYTIKEISKFIKVGRNAVNRYLKQGTKLNWCNYNPKEELIKNSKRKGRTAKKIINLNTNIIYRSANEIQTLLNIDRKQVTEVCKNEREYAGQSQYGIFYEWMFYEDYLKLHPELKEVI